MTVSWHSEEGDVSGRLRKSTEAALEEEGSEGDQHSLGSDLRDPGQGSSRRRAMGAQSPAGADVRPRKPQPPLGWQRASGSRGGKRDVDGPAPLRLGAPTNKTSRGERHP